MTQLKLEMWENSTAVKKSPLIMFCIISAFIIGTFIFLQSIDTTKLKFNTENNADYSFSWNQDNVKVSEKEFTAENIFTDISRIKGNISVINGLFFSLALIFSLQYAGSVMLNDRRDQSILFFKSLPVSEWQVILTRLAMAAFVIPIVALIGAFLTTIIYLVVAGIFSSMHGLSFMHVFGSINPLYNVAVIFIKILLIGIWAFPLLTWMFLAGAWAKKHPIILSGFTLFAVLVIERWVFNSHHISNVVGQYFNGFSIGGEFSVMPNFFERGYSAGGILSFFLRPGLWLGLIISALFLLGTVFLRNRRFEL